MDMPPVAPSALSSPHSRQHYYATPSCDRALGDHHIGADSNASTTTTPDTPTTTPSVRSTNTGSFYHARSIHGAVPIVMTPQDEDALFNPDHGGGGQSISAFAAVSHYPYVEPGESERLAVDEVVNVHAVVGRGGYMYDFGERGGRRQGAGDTEGYTITEGAGRRPWTVEGAEDIDVGMSSLSSPDYDDEDGDGGEDDPDDTRKFYPDAVLRRDREWPGGGVSLAGVPDFDYGGFHWGGAEVENDGNDENLEYDYDSTSQSEGIPVSQETLDTLQDNSTGAVDAISISGEPNGPMFGIAIEDFPVTTYERNFTVDQFVDQWIYQSNPQTRNNQLFVPPYRTSTILSVDRPEKIVRSSGDDGLDFFDLQQIPWWDRLRAKRTDARTQRDLWYRPYHNVDHAPHEAAKLIHRPEFYFREKAMYMKHRASIEHFQLRNLMSAPAYNTVHFACASRLLSWVPGYDDLTCLIDLSRPPKNTVLEGPTKISTMKTGLGVSIVGGFAGEYAIRADTLSSSTGLGPGTPNTAGYVTRDLNGITNHIDIISHRTAHSPTAIFASNDNHLRVLDCETDTFTSDVDLSRAVNCTSTSPDGRLRVIVGDSPEALILEADTGRPVRPLHAHRDFGFACAWSPDMWHIATANQDKTTIIWDARMWRPLTMLAADVAGYRSLKFSPVGGGERSLLMVEPADRIVLVNASTYESRQVHDFFGEIAGADFSPDGAGVWVANADDNYGGFMEFERRGWGSKFGPGAGAGACSFVNEWAGDDGLSDDERCVVGNKREREFRFLRNWSDEEYEKLLL